jgi:hypothetical protein
MLRPQSAILRYLSKLKKKIPWPKFASKLYRPSDRHLSAKLVQTFADGSVTWSA